MAYQLEPLRKALRLPRVNLFIADDVGLGKTIEAGLIVRELLLRQKVRRIVVAAPPSVILQWRDELESRFGLQFVVFDRAYVLRIREERGYGANPWNTHSRFIISHALLRDEAYAAPLRDWLDDGLGALLILDEAHNAAPASGARYAIDSILTKIVRELAPLFEHRLFLSATPHNGHSNSFASLLELLDPQRFCRGVPVKGEKQLEPVMVRRLKEDLRKIAGGFPRRDVVQIDITALPTGAPELRLSQLLAEYKELREERFRSERKSVQNAAALITTSLQKRLLSSVEAFARTLAVHRRSVEAQKAAPTPTPELEPENLPLLLTPPGRDDDRGELDDEQIGAEEDAQMEAASRAARKTKDDASDQKAREDELLDEMTRIAGAARGQPDARVAKLVDWIREHMCPGLPPLTGNGRTAQGKWNDRRVLIFTEYTDTKRYLEQQLRAAVEGTDGAEERIATFTGGMGEDTREEIKKAFNTDPTKHALRILIATDAAREGVNLQNHCADLFHFDVPWNPSRMEQRNGRIDRKLQRAEVVRCHYFYYHQRPEDAVLKALIAKTEKIQRELGSLTPVVDRRLEKLLQAGIRREAAARLAKEIEQDEQADERSRIDEELEETREREVALQKQLDELRDLLEDSKEALGMKEDRFRASLSCALELLGAEPLAPMSGEREGRPRWRFPALDRQTSTWADTLDTLRPPRQRDHKPWDWRRETQPRPVVFSDPGTLDEDVVHLHLEHRVAKRLLGRFLAQGFVHHDLSRACVGQTEDAIPRVLVLGRLSLYGERASRLHDEIVTVSARWIAPETRKGPLRPHAEEGKAKSLDLLDKALLAPKAPSDVVRKNLLASLARDVTDLLPHLEERGEELAKKAMEKLADRGQKEAKAMAEILKKQRERIEKALQEDPQRILEFDEQEKRQLEAERKRMRTRVDAIPEELEREPERIRNAYAVKARRLEPVGVVYLWPVSS
jgi:SNF2 family DNA or RNA helicase